MEEERPSPSKYTSYAGLSSDKLHRTSEPPIICKRKQESHELKRTFTTDYLENGEKSSKSTQPGEQAMRYKAGYRRVNFNTPTEYMLHYGWKSPFNTDESPLMSAVNYRKPQDPNKENKSQTHAKKHRTGMGPVSSTEKPLCKSNIKEKPVSQHYKTKYLINGVHVNGQTHTIVKQPVKPVRPPIKQGRDMSSRHPPVDGSTTTPPNGSDNGTLDAERVRKMQSQFENRMNVNGSVTHTGHDKTPHECPVHKHLPDTRNTRHQHPHTRDQHLHTRHQHPHTRDQHLHTRHQHPHTRDQHPHTTDQHPHTDTRHQHPHTGDQYPPHTRTRDPPSNKDVKDHHPHTHTDYFHTNTKYPHTQSRDLKTDTHISVENGRIQNKEKPSKTKQKAQNKDEPGLEHGNSDKNLHHSNGNVFPLSAKSNDRESSSPPLATEYHIQFNKVWPIQEAFGGWTESGQAIGFKDHVKDIIYSYPKSPVQAHSSDNVESLQPTISPDSPHNVKQESSIPYTPHTYKEDWDTEYSSNFVSPMQLNYVNGVWQGAPQPDLFLHPPTPLKNKFIAPRLPHGTHTDRTVVGEEPLPSQQSSAASSWFDQVIELREKVCEYKQRGDGIRVPDQLSKIHKAQMELFERATCTSSSLSVESVSNDSSEDGDIRDMITHNDRHLSLHTPSIDIEVDDIESNVSVCGSCSEGRTLDGDLINHSPVVCTCTTGLPQSRHDDQTTEPENEDSNKHPFDRTTPSKEDTLITRVPPSIPYPRMGKTDPILPVAPKRGIKVSDKVARPLKTSTAPVLVYGKPKPTGSTRKDPRKQSSPPDSKSRKSSKLAGKATVPVPRLDLFHSHQTTPFTPSSPSHSPPLPHRPMTHSPLTSTKHTLDICDICGAQCGMSCDKPHPSVLKTKFDDCEICKTTLKSLYPQRSQKQELKPPVQPSTSHSKQHFTVKSPPFQPCTTCPPSCPNVSLCQDDSFSLSSVSLSSSCSVASEILERAKNRRDKFWSY